MFGTSLKRVGSADRLAQASTALPPAAGASHAASHRHQRRLALRFRGCRLGLPVPSEMWGAAALAARMARPSCIQPQQLHRAASAVLAQAFSAAAVPPPSGPVSEDNPKALAEALEWQPRLSAAEEAASLLGPAAICAAVYAATAPASVQPLYATAMALLYGALVLGTHMWLVERRYKAVQRSERELAASDSCFFMAEGIQLHYKRRAPLGLSRPAGIGGRGNGSMLGSQQQQQQAAAASAPAAVVHCLHGFGASSYSWSFVQQEMADALHAVVTAHDMPGFGLSQRPRSPSYYTLHFNGDTALSILDAELSAAQQAAAVSHSAASTTSSSPAAALPPQQKEQLRSHPVQKSASAGSVDSTGSADDCTGDSFAAGGPSPAAPSAAWPKRVLIGHSMGGAAAAEGVISCSEGVDALVLVAPAIVAFWLGPPEEAAGDPMATGLAVVEELVAAEDAPGEIQRWPSSSSSSSSPLLSRSDSASSTSGATGGRRRKLGVAGRAQRVVRAAAVVAKATLLLLVRLLLAVATPLLVVLLRRLVRSRRFWERGLASAWYDGRKVTSSYVDAYRSGQLVRGWEEGILRFLAARFDEKAGFWGSLREAVQGEGHLTQAERLAAVVRRCGIRVLIVHGSSDVLVPAANSRRLAALLPNAELAVFEGCGHMPQEECPERFVETVQRFVDSLD